jgi:hypothetical protein
VYWHLPIFKDIGDKLVKLLDKQTEVEQQYAGKIDNVQRV